jgi:hypothetical protein
MKTQTCIRKWTAIFGATSALALFATQSGSAAGTGQLGILDTSGTNPNTGVEWAIGDAYRLVFVSSTTVDSADPAMDGISAWNSAVQAIADNAGLGADGNGNTVTWNIIGSTINVDARDNTSTNPNVDGTGHAIMNMDGSSVIENNFTELWDGNAPQNVALYDEFGVSKDSSTAVDWPFTGTNFDGTAASGLELRDLSGGGSIRQGRNQASTGGGAGWIDANNVGSNWSDSGALSVYGMSEPLTVVPEASATLLIGLAGLALLRRRR